MPKRAIRNPLRLEAPESIVLVQPNSVNNDLKKMPKILHSPADIAEMQKATKTTT
jgi:hypothetical protein